MLSKPPSPRLTIPQAVVYLKEKHGIKVHKNTLYNWIKNGVQGTKLKSMLVQSHKWQSRQDMVTTKEWLHEFFSGIGQPLAEY